MSEDTSDRDQQILHRLTRIQHKIDSLEQTNAFALRADAEKHNATVRSIFRKSERKAQIYLATDGNRSVQGIADHLGIKRANASRALGDLEREGLVEIADTIGSSNIYAKKPLDRTLRITPFLTKTFLLQPDGKKSRS